MAKHIITGSVIDPEHPLAVDAAPVPAMGVAIAAKTVPTVAAETIGAAQALQRGVFVQSLPTNQATVYIGPAGVTAANGLALLAGDCLWVPVDNVADVWCISATAAQVLRIMAV